MYVPFFLFSTDSFLTPTVEAKYFCVHTKMRSARIHSAMEKEYSGQYLAIEDVRSRLVGIQAIRLSDGLTRSCWIDKGVRTQSGGNENSSSWRPISRLSPIEVPLMHLSPASSIHRRESLQKLCLRHEHCFSLDTLLSRIWFSGHV